MTRSLDDLLMAALAREEGRDRESWIAATCGDDAELELELRRLIAAAVSSGQFMVPGAGGRKRDRRDETL
jgi:hypothetical protein